MLHKLEQPFQTNSYLKCLVKVRSLFDLEEVKTYPSIWPECRTSRTRVIIVFTTLHRDWSRITIMRIAFWEIHTFIHSYHTITESCTSLVFSTTNEVYTNLCIQSLLTRSFLCHLWAICVAFTKEVFYSERRAIDCMFLIKPLFSQYSNIINFFLDGCTLFTVEERYLEKWQPIKHFRWKELKQLYTNQITNTININKPINKHHKSLKVELLI